MAASLSGSGGRGRRRSRRGRAALSEINVTPMVDVMLVLLIIFMVSAPLLSVGVPVELPRTDAAAMDEQSVPLTVTIRRDGSIFVQDRPATLEEVAPRLSAMSGEGVVAQVMAKLSTSGISSINLVTDTGAAPPVPTPLRPAT